MIIKVLHREFSICKIQDLADVQFADPFCFLQKTDEELSLVCSTAFVPEKTTAREDGWRCMRIEGLLDFSLIGILAKISSALAKQQISLFASSTYNTDYILVKEEKLQKALDTLRTEGYEIILETPDV